MERRELLRLAAHCGDDPDESALTMTTAGQAGCDPIGNIAPIPIGVPPSTDPFCLRVAVNGSFAAIEYRAPLLHLLFR